MTYFLKKKKWMAWVVLLTFLFTSFMPSNLLAGNSVASAEGAINQIVKQGSTSYYKGSGLGNQAIVGSGNESDYQASTSKTIEQVGENEFDITLKVMTTQELENIKMTQDAAVVIVLDKSNSMKWNSQSSHNVASEKQRITLATAAVNDFITKYKANTSGKAYLSIVEFAGSVSTYNFGNNYFQKYWVDAKTDLASDWALRKPGTAGDTNINGALNRASTLLSDDVVKDVSNKYVILLTDGAPTKGGGEGTIKSTAKTLQNKATVYTIAYGNEAPVGLLESVASAPAYALKSNETENLNLVFGEISENIKLLSSAWQVTDPMSEHITLLGLYDKNGGLTDRLSYSSNGQSVVYCTAENGTIDWNLLITPVKEEKPPFSYTLKYRVRLDNTFDDFTENNSFATNGETTLVYAMADENSKVTAGPFTVGFDVPEVKGFLGKVNGKTDISFVKVDADDETLLANAQFELKLADSDRGNHENSHTADSAYMNGVTKISSKDGTFSFKDIPSGHTYTLTEKQAPANHKLGGPWTVEVNYSVVTVKDSSGNKVTSDSGKFVIENEKITQDITITKRWVNQENFAPAVTLELLQDGKAFVLSSTQSNLPAGITVTVDKVGKHTYVNLPAQTSNIVDQTVTLKVPVGYNYTVQEVVKNINGSTYNVVNGPVMIDGKKWNVSANGLIVTNTYIGETSVSGTKTWVDGGKVHDNADEIVLILTRTSAKAGSVAETVNATPVWEDETYTYSNLAKYDNEGYAYTYSVTEAAVTGYTSEKNGYDFTNTADTINDKTAVSGTKTWVDGGKVHNNADEIVLTLTRTSAKAGSVAETVNATPVWEDETYTYSNLAKYDNEGYAYTYSVTEAEMDGYTSTQDGYDITNTVAQESLTISGTKSWNVPEDIKADVVPDQIEVQLFCDDVYMTTTATALDWTYSFTDLPKYDVDGDGHAYDYTVKEVPVPGFISVVNGFDIINTYDRSATTSVHVEKVWNDFNTNVGAHPTITIELYQNGILFETQELSNDNLELDFKELPKYDANQQPFTYTVKEVPVNGYTSTVSGSTTEGFTITNTLVLGKPGTITVGKVAQGDNRPNADTRYKFELQIQVVHPEGRNALFDAEVLDETTLGEAATAVNDALYAVQDSVMMTTSTSQYQYVLTEKANVFDTTAKALMGVEYGHTSPSAIIFEDGFMVEQSEIDSEFQYNITGNVLSALYTLSADYKADEIGDLLVALAEKVPMSDDGYTFTMDKAAVENLIEAVHVYNGLAGNLPLAPETDAPNALQVFQTINGVTTQSQLTFVENENGGYYKVDFWLASGDTINFALQATSGSAIYYRMVESLDTLTSANHTGTSIFDSVHGTTTSGTAIDFVAFDEDAAMNYVFTNSYSNNSRPTDPEDPTDPERPTNPDPEGPDIDIEDPDVPLAEPDEPPIEIEDPDVPLTDVPGEPIEIDEPEVPLGDAPKTGDSSNAIPFVVLMMVASIGLAITRRKFN